MSVVSPFCLSRVNQQAKSTLARVDTSPRTQEGTLGLCCLGGGGDREGPWLWPLPVEMVELAKAALALAAQLPAARKPLDFGHEQGVGEGKQGLRWLREGLRGRLSSPAESHGSHTVLFKDPGDRTVE